MEYNCRLRVLVVDPNPVRRTSLINKLRSRFGEVYAAEGEGADLLRDARAKIIDHRCHVAVATPLLDHPDDFAESLDALENALAPAGIVVCATHENDRLAFRAGRRGMEYVRCTDPTSDLCAAAAAQGREACNCHLRVHWPQQDFTAGVARRLKQKDTDITDENLLDLLGRLFPKAANVELTPLTTLATSTLVASAVRHAVVLLASEQRPLVEARRIPKVLKIGPSEQIAREKRSYDRYVDGWLQQDRQARLENYANLWHLGAITYAFLGVAPNQLVPFRYFYLKRRSSEVLFVLRQLFTETCHNWYAKERQVIDGVRLFEVYDGPLNLRKRVQERIDTSAPYLAFDGVSRRLVNPARWALEVGSKITSDRVTTSITHGDLHGDNLFVDRSGQAWLIDFEQTGPAHALRDFVELEADIKLRLTMFQEQDYAGLEALESSLLTGERLDTPLLPRPAVVANPRLLKAFEVVAGLRHLAYITTGIADAYEYYYALFYETLFMATLRRLHKSVRVRALLSAALIAQRLQDGGHADPLHVVPRLDIASLESALQTHSVEALQAHLRHLSACQDALVLQEGVYEDAAPELLQTALAALNTEQHRAQYSLDAVKGGQTG